MKLPNLEFTPEDLKLGPFGERRRFRWPWNRMEPGDYINVTAPTPFISHVRSTALCYARSDGAIKLSAKVLWRRWDHDHQCWFTKLRVVAHAAGMPVPPGGYGPDRDADPDAYDDD
jgi:hypothetical protein